MTIAVVLNFSSYFIFTFYFTFYSTKQIVPKQLHFNKQENNR